MALPLLYPAKIDRYWIIEKLVRGARQTYREVGIKQTDLAQRADVPQSTISNLENLAKTFEDPRRCPNREELLKVLTWGLELQQEHLDTLLWLYDGQPLTEQEIRPYVRGYIPKAVPKNYCFTELRRLVLEHLKEMLISSTRSDRIKILPVRIIPFGEEAMELETYEELLQLEQIPGQSLVIMGRPSCLVHSKERHASGELCRFPVTTPEGRQRWLEINQRRVECFFDNLTNYGERSIHSKPVLRNYLTGKHLSDTEREQRREQIQHWITLLESYKHYQVGLVETPCFCFELKLKGTVQAMVRSPFEEEEKYFRIWQGPRYFLLFDENTVFQFFLTFEGFWDTIPEEDRAKERVIEFLRGVVEGKT